MGRAYAAQVCPHTHTHARNAVSAIQAEPVRADEHDVEFVHYCVYCSWNREASSLTMLSPRCERCGCALRADAREAFKRIAPTLRETAVPIRRRTDTTTVFGCLVSLPFLLPLFGVHISDIAFAVPLVMLLFATVRCAQASTRSAHRRGMWRALTAACASAAAASAIALASAVAGGTLTVAFYFGTLGSIGLLVAGSLLAWRTLRGARLERIVDALLWCAVIAASGTYFVVIPGFAGGDAVLTSVFLIDLAAVVMFAVAVIVGLEPQHRRMGWWLVGAAATAAVGDALVAMDAAGWLPTLSGLAALLWAAAGFAVATAAEHETADTAASEPAEEPTGARWLVGRVLLPLTAVVFFPALGLAIWLDEGRLDPWQVAFFAAFFVLALVAAFGRQAYLLLDNRRAVTRERRLRREVMSRNAELEALTGLATTMTQTLEEAPIIEQALGVLHLAARASSSALHGIGPNGHKLLATTGDWQDDEPWVGVPPEDAQPVEIGTRGRRSIARFQLSARGHTIGTVSLVRPDCDALTDEGVRLLRLLVDEMAVAVQNARDYREKLEQAIRDPLTGLYNRRFFFEALDKEIGRHERYGSCASLVMFDVDDFKQINDRHGHAIGDDVLRKIAHVGQSLLRPTDSFARIGGEEFALLLPETQQLDALLVAERVRTAIGRSTMLADRRVTVSGGVSSCPQDAISREELEKKADAALYWAKRNGKDLCAVASEVVRPDDSPGESDGMIAHLYAMVAAIDARELATRDHSENVAAYAVAIGQAMGLERERIMGLRRAALLHDIGKITVAANILSKPGKLDPHEWTQIHRHPTVGATMLAHAGLAEESRWIRHHHERIDGNGYPDQLVGTQIPLEARIIFVADSFEAMTSDRPYRAGMDVSEALAELNRCSGTQFDPRIVDALAELIDAGELAVLALRAEPVG
jgi:diguanylate cyclase (GGDEF)-like protein/putative nucleotidyltransferase with HDIG domain